MTSSPLLGAGQLATAARLYQSLGLSVLPWRYAPHKKTGKLSKTPQRLWTVGEQPPMSAEDVAGWWRMYPNHNVGIITGPTRSRALVVPTDVAVLDLDTPEALAWAQANLADTPWKTHTGREGGGQHWGYRYPVLPPGWIIQTGTNVNGVPGLDVRGFGGYVGMPPSLHKSGKYYEWQGSELETLAGLPFLDTTKIKPVEHRAAQEDEDEQERPASTVMLQRASEWLAAQRPAVEGQGGDAYTFSVCATLRRGFALDMDQAWDVIQPWNARCVPPWDDEDLERKLLKGRREGTEDLGRRGIAPTRDSILEAFKQLPKEKIALPSIIDAQPEPVAEADPIAEAKARAFQIPGDVVIDVGAAFEAEALSAAGLLYRKDQPAYHRLRAELKNCGTKFSLKDWEKEVAKTAKAANVPKVKAINESGDRKRVVLTGDEKAVCDAILNVLKDAPTIYVRDNTLCYIADGEVQTLRKDRLRNAITQFCAVVKPMHDKGTDSYVDVAMSLPNPIIGMLSELLPEQVALFRVVDQIVTYPFCSEADGIYRLVTEEGYDAATRTVLTKCPGIEMERFPTVQEAVKYLTWMVKDFPFVSTSERDNFISAMLTVVVRPAIQGVTPLVILEGNQPDVGKSLLAQLLVSLSGICPAELTPWPDEGVKEATKKMLPVLRRSQPVHAWDNVRGTLESTQLEGSLTARVISLRTLGVSSDETYPNRTLWVLTANNMDANRDTTRRSMRVRLVKTRQVVYEIKDFAGFMHRERPVILAALLKLVEHWIEQGAQELPSLPKISSFESWSTIVGSIMHSAGLTEWLTNFKEAQEAMSRGDDWSAFIHAWYDTHKVESVSTAQLWIICTKTGLLGAVLGDQSDRSQQTRLGKALAKQHQAVFGALQVQLQPQRANSALYRLHRIALTGMQEDDSLVGVVGTAPTGGFLPQQSAA